MLKVSQDGESLAQYLQKLITIRAQIPNVQDDVVIAAAIEGLDIGQCASYLSREEPKTVNKLFEEIRKFAKSEEDLKRRKAIKRAPNSSIHAIASQDWRAPIFAFVSGSYEPEDKHEMLRMQSRTKHYSIIGGNLYKDGVVAPKLKCISKEEGMKLLNEIHSGMCGTHRGPHEIAHRAMR